MGIFQREPAATLPYTRPFLNKPLSSQRIPALDGLRGLAVLMVLGIHFLYAGFFPQPPPVIRSLTHVLQFGWMGVDLFLVLSGFLITGILVDTRDAPNFFRSFYARRSLRIFPLYYLVLLTALLTLPLQWPHASLRRSIPHPSGWPYLFVYLTNWWSPLMRRDAGYFGLYWTLAIEEQFYLVWPMLIFFLKPRSFLRVCVCLCVATPLLRLAFEVREPTSFFVFTNTLTRMDSLVWGALAALLVRSQAVWQRFRGYLPVVAAGCAALLLVIDFPLHDFYTWAFYTQTIGFSVIAIGFAALLLMAWESDGVGGRLARVLRVPLLTQFGRYSYGIYVLHTFVLIAFRARLLHTWWAGRSLLMSLLAYVAFNVVCFLVAALSFHAYEKHFLKLKRRFRAQAPVPAVSVR